MFTFKDLNEAIIKLDNIISIISENIWKLRKLNTYIT
jgi:hypothetical protein